MSVELPRSDCTCLKVLQMFTILQLKFNIAIHSRSSIAPDPDGVHTVLWKKQVSQVVN